MTRPIAGKSYTTKAGDTLRRIAALAYGLESKWTLIRDTNAFEFVVDDAESVQAGEVIFIPEDPELVSLRQ